MSLGMKKTATITIVCIAMAGCTLENRPEFLSPTADSAPKQTSQLVARDIEAPHIFQVTEQGLWDGTPSLGGVWVTHNDVDNPERVIIRNTDNNKFVIGALFEKQNNPESSAFEVSSDTARALGLRANKPINLTVTALRSKDAPEDATPAPAVSQQKTDVTPEPILAQPIETATPEKLLRPYIQVGIFSSLKNAQATKTRFENQGIPTQIKEFVTGNKTLWRVMSGPEKSVPARDALLHKIQRQGFADAYAVNG